MQQFETSMFHSSALA